MFPDRTHSSSAHSITSSRNPLLKDVRRAVQRGTLTEKGFCVAETPHLVQEAIRSGCEINVVIAAEGAAEEAETILPPDNSVPLLRIPNHLFADVAATESSQGVLALVKPPEPAIQAMFGRDALVPVLDGVQDPGNAGAIVRVAEAF